MARVVCGFRSGGCHILVVTRVPVFQSYCLVYFVCVLIVRGEKKGTRLDKTKPFVKQNVLGSFISFLYFSGQTYSAGKCSIL